MKLGPRACAGAPSLLLAGLVLALSAAAARAEPLLPAHDDEVVERLPAGRAAAAQRLARRQLAQRPRDAGLAAQIARAGLERARASGDPRHAGQALAALAPWRDAQTAPPEVLLLQATLEQHLHEFDAAAARLEVLLRRRPGDAQAWLTLAAVRRVQGRYAQAEDACAGVARAGAELHAAACTAELEGLRGRFDRARSTLQRLAARSGLDAVTAAWLHATRAELEQRAGDRPASEAAWRAALRAGADAYAAIGFADFLLERGRTREALDVLAAQPSSEAVLLRRADAGDADAARELRARFAQATLRPQTILTHGRELAWLALRIDHDAPRALALARTNLQRQREPVDLWLLAEAARAAGDGAARDDALRLAAAQGLVDTRWTILADRSPT